MDKMPNCHLCNGSGTILIDNGEEVVRYENCGLLIAQSLSDQQAGGRH
jgi:hypothetical protein